MVFAEIKEFEADWPGRRNRRFGWDAIWAFYVVVNFNEDIFGFEHVFHLCKVNFICVATELHDVER